MNHKNDLDLARGVAGRGGGRGEFGWRVGVVQDTSCACGMLRSLRQVEREAALKAQAAAEQLQQEVQRLQAEAAEAQSKLADSEVGAVGIHQCCGGSIYHCRQKEPVARRNAQLPPKMPLVLRSCRRR